MLLAGRVIKAARRLARHGREGVSSSGRPENQARSACHGHAVCVVCAKNLHARAPEANFREQKGEALRPVRNISEVVQSKVAIYWRKLILEASQAI